MKIKSDIPVLIDFDGVIKIGGKPAEDLEKFIEFIYSQNVHAIIVSNSTLHTSKNIKKFFTENNFEINIPILTAVDAALNYIKKNYTKVSVYCSEEIKKEFLEFIDDEKAEAVLVGDLGKDWSPQILNEIFRKVKSGNDFIAMQKNKFWKPDGINLALDAGSYIAAIEYAADIEAKLIGKPSPLYFQSAIEQLGFKEKFPFIMIGDDLETDVYAAQNIGGIGVLVYTGKTKYPLPQNSSFHPDFEAQNLTEVIDLLKNKI